MLFGLSSTLKKILEKKVMSVEKSLTFRRYIMSVDELLYVESTEWLFPELWNIKRVFVRNIFHITLGRSK